MQRLSVFTDVTFEGVHLPQNHHFVAYDASDGSLHILRCTTSQKCGQA